MAIDFLALVLNPVTLAIIFAIIISIPFKLKWNKIDKAKKADWNKRHEIKGIVDGVILMPYIPSGGLFDLFGDREEQTLVVFEDESRITIEGLHPEIKKGQSRIIIYRGTDNWFEIKPLIEIKMF